MIDKTDIRRLVLSRKDLRGEKVYLKLLLGI